MVRHTDETQAQFVLTELTFCVVKGFVRRVFVMSQHAVSFLAATQSETGNRITVTVCLWWTSDFCRFCLRLYKIIRREATHWSESCGKHMSLLWHHFLWLKVSISYNHVFVVTGYRRRNNENRSRYNKNLLHHINMTKHCVSQENNDLTLIIQHLVNMICNNHHICFHDYDVRVSWSWPSRLVFMKFSDL